MGEELLASKAVKWLNEYFGNRDSNFFNVFPELPTLHFDDLLPGDVGDSTSCSIAYTVDSAIARAYQLLRDPDGEMNVHVNGMEIVPEDVFITVNGEFIDISNVHTSGDGYEREVSICLHDWVIDFIRSFDDGDCPSYDRNLLEDNYETYYEEQK